MGIKGLPENSITINLKGIAGQSFGAFLSKGMNLYLDGAANDYVGKGMNGGKIIINPVHQGKILQVQEILVYMVLQVENYMLEQL